MKKRSNKEKFEQRHIRTLRNRIKKNYEYRDGAKNLNEVENKIFWSFQDKVKNIVESKDYRVMKVNDNHMEGNIYDLEILFRIFHNLNIEYKELMKINIAVDRYAEIVHIKKYIFDRMIEIMKDIDIKGSNYEEVQYLIGMILNDSNFFNYYARKDKKAMEVIKDVIHKMYYGENYKDTLEDYFDNNEDNDIEQFENSDIVEKNDE